MKVEKIPKFENLNKVSIDEFELTNSVLTPIHLNTNYDQPQTDLLLNQYCIITKMHCLIKKNSHRKWVCRRCLTAFRSEQILFDHTSRCIKQQPTDITFSWKDHLKFVDNFMKIPLPIRVYADFECIIQPTRNDSKVLFEQIPLAVGFYLISPFGNQYYSYIGESCVTWFVLDFWSTLKQTTPPDEEINRTQEI